MRVAWTAYAADDPATYPPSGGEYWLAIVYENGRRFINHGTREYSKPHDIFRTADLGGCDEFVTHYAPYMRPEFPS